MARQISLLLILGLLAWGLLSQPALAGIAGGIALFLFGMLSLEQGFHSLTGGVLERFLKSATNRRWKSLAFGALATAISQSSSLVSVITIAFLSAGLIGLVSGIGVIFGANLGTTSGAWLMAAFGLKFDIGGYALPLLTFGVLGLFSREQPIRGLGQVVLGIGLVFLGIDTLKEGFETFQSALDLTRFALSGLTGLVVYTLIGIVATVIMQSSHATLILTITALSAGQLSYDNALAISIGANVGTTVTALISAVGANIEGKRLALAHLVFNVVTATVALTVMPLFLIIVDQLAIWMGIQPESYALKLALFHTLFNLAGLVIMVPFISPLAAMLETRVQSRPLPVSKPRHINEQMLATPGAALEAVRLELLRLLKRLFKLIARTIGFEPAQLKRHGDEATLMTPPESLRAIDVEQLYRDRIKSLHGLILDFLSRIPAQGYRSEQLTAMRLASRELIEAAKDAKHLQKNLIRYLTSGNRHMREEYLNHRARIGRRIHELQQLAIDQPESADQPLADAFNTLMAANDEQDHAAGERLEELIRNRRVTPEQATSLMNDGVYTSRICTNLTRAAQRLYSPLADRADEGGEG